MNSAMSRSKRLVLFHCIAWLMAGFIGFATPVFAQQGPASDTEIQTAIKEEFLFDSAVPNDEISVVVSEGIATLDGSVRNLLAHDRAARIASTVRGVRSVVNDIDVEPVGDFTDPELAADAEQALMEDAATDSWEIDVTVADQAATLTGTVESWQERELAARVVKGVHGLKEVKNSINVAPAEERPDSEMKAEIKAALKQDVLINDGLIDVKVDDARVELSGTVGSAAEKDEATLDAWVAGVEHVDNSGLEVKGWAKEEDLRADKFVPKTDEEIREAINDSLLYDPRVFSFNIRPEVSAGIVTLHGEVDNLKARRAAAEDARNTVRVLKVNNEIEVTTGDEPNDLRIADRVRSSIARDPFLESYEITVTSIDGEVNLTGMVDSYFEKAQAGDLAARVTGVSSIENDLIVEEDEELFSYDPYVDDWWADDVDWYASTATVKEKDDSKIVASIESQFFWSPFVDGGDISISVNEGVATLRGNVDSWAERMAATENALEGGAIKVVNELVVM